MVNFVTPRAENGNLIFICFQCHTETRQPWRRFRQLSNAVRSDGCSEFVECERCSARLRFHLEEIEKIVSAAQAQRPDHGNTAW